MAVNIITGACLQGSTVTCLSRLISADGTYLTQADISSIAYQVTDIQLGSNTGGGSLVVADTVFNALQTDVIWDVDDVGYNFKFSVPGSCFPQDKTYQVDVRFTPVTAPIFRIAYQLRAYKVYQS